MPDILTKPQKYCGFADNFERCMRPIADGYWCPLHPFAPVVEFTESRPQTDLRVSEAVPGAKNQSSADSESVVTTPETIRISLPALRAVVLGVIDERRWRFYSHLWANDDTAETEAVEHCEQFVDLICERLRQLPARG